MGGFERVEKGLIEGHGTLVYVDHLHCGYHDTPMFGQW